MDDLDLQAVQVTSRILVGEPVNSRLFHDLEELTVELLRDLRRLESTRLPEPNWTLTVH